MRRVFPFRPSTITYGLPGNSKTQAHAGKPSRKLATLDPVVAHKELLSPAAHPAPKVHALVEKLTRAEATSPPAPRHPISRLAKALGRGFTKVTGLSPGKPKPQEQLLRYAGTSPQTQGQAAEPAAGADPARTLVQALGHEQAHLQAQIEMNEADGVDALVAQHRDEAAQRLALLTRRATHLADRAHELTRQRTDMAAELAELHAAIPATAEALAAAQTLLIQAQSGIDRHHRVRPHEEARPGTSRSGHQLGELLQAERRRELDEQAVAYFQQVRDEQDGLLKAQHARQAQIKTELPTVEAQLAQAVLSARVTAGDLFEQDEAVAALADLQPLLQPVRDHRAEALAATRATAQEARAGLQVGRQAHLEDQIKALQGFAATPHAEPLRQALREWASGLEPATAAWGAQALSASDVLSIAVAASERGLRIGCRAGGASRGRVAWPGPGGPGPPPRGPARRGAARTEPGCKAYRRTAGQRPAWHAGAGPPDGKTAGTTARGTHQGTAGTRPPVPACAGAAAPPAAARRGRLSMARRGPACGMPGLARAAAGRRPGRSQRGRTCRLPGVAQRLREPRPRLGL